MSALATRARTLLDALAPSATALGGEMPNYLAYHRERFVALAELVAPLIDHRLPACRVLDVGPAFQTRLFRQLWPAITLDTFGFVDPKFPTEPPGRHIAYDLTSARDQATWPPVDAPYDVIIFAEVFEHLHVAPERALACLAARLAPRGALVLTTPNAVSLRNRLLMLAGRNPFEPLRDSLDNPGHFREYTTAELARFGEALGLRVARVVMGHWSSTGRLASRAVQRLSPLLWPSLRKDQAIVFVRAER
ncbi:MAG: methyltransferase domain-containing protein [Gemmatimonadaceae bacterium]|nr:methyltransferase domain-containing protein [Gemmatimonadaceae bacterium]